MRVRLLLLLAVVVGVLAPSADSAQAAPSLCGYATVVIAGDPTAVPLIPYCDSCPNGISQGPNNPGVNAVRIYTYECVRA